MGWPIVPRSQDEERAYRTSGAATNKLLRTGILTRLEFALLLVQVRNLR